jgi:hypothetical protein
MKKQGEVIPINNHGEESNILLLLLPFWTPLIPPLGLASLKSYLQQHGYRVKVVDANIDEQFKRIYEKYFNSLRRVPGKLIIL